MTASTISLDEKTNALLTALSEQTGLPPNRVLEEALDNYRRRLFFEGLKADYAALKADPAAWAEELAERRSTEGTASDGLDADERWTADGGCLGASDI